MPEKTKKSTKTTRTTTEVKTSAAMPENNVSAKIESPQNRNKLILLAVLIVLAILAFKLKGEFIVATVNGAPITRMDLMQTLEEQAGKQALDSLIVKQLIRQEAKKANITITPEEARKEIDTLEKQLKEQGQNLDEFLEAQGLTRESITEQAELQLMLEKLTAKDVKVTQKEIDEAFEEQKSILEDNEELTEKELRDQIKKSLELQKKTAAIQAWVQSAREKAEITILKDF